MQTDKFGEDAIADQQIERIAELVCALLGARVKPWLRRKLRAWPEMIEDADDLGQLAALAFVRAYRLGRIKVDVVQRVHTASSVSAYLWGICNKVFVDAVRRSRRDYRQLDELWVSSAGSGSSTSSLEQFLPGGPGDDEESQVWDVLESVKQSCLPQDIIMTYLLGCGFTSGEVVRLLRLSINMPAKALKRVGLALRQLCGIEPAVSRRAGGQSGQGSVGTANPGIPAPTPFDLLQQGNYTVLLDVLGSPKARNLFLSEAAAALGSEFQSNTESLAARQHAIRASGDWSWGLLPAESRRALLLRDARFLYGSGVPDEGAGQKAAVEKLVAELGNIFQEFDRALLGDDVAWLLPLAELLHVLLGMVSEYKEMRQRYSLLLEAAVRIGSPRLRLLALLGLGRAMTRLGQTTEARELLEQARELARELREPQGESTALWLLALAAWELAEFAAGVELSAESLALARARGDRFGEARALGCQAMIYSGQANYDLALQLQGEALAIRREIGDKAGEATSLGNLAATQGNRGFHTESRDYYAQCRALCMELGDRRGVARATNGLALIHSAMREFDEALEKHQESLALFRELGDIEGVSWSLRCLSGLHSEMGDLEEAVKLGHEAIAIAREIGDKQGEAVMLVGCGNDLIKQGEHSVARESLIQGLDQLMKIGDKSWICRACGVAAILFVETGAYRQGAIALYGTVNQAELLTLGFDQNEARPLERIRGVLQAKVDTVEILPEQLALWCTQGKSLSLTELAELSLAALRQSDSAY